MSTRGRAEAAALQRPVRQRAVPNTPNSFLCVWSCGERFATCARMPTTGAFCKAEYPLSAAVCQAHPFVRHVLDTGPSPMKRLAGPRGGGPSSKGKPLTIRGDSW